MTLKHPEGVEAIISDKNIVSYKKQKFRMIGFGMVNNQNQIEFSNEHYLIMKKNVELTYGKPSCPIYMSYRNSEEGSENIDFDNFLTD